MRKNINKIVAIAIGISVIRGSVMPVFAADTTQIAQTTQNTNIRTQTNQKAVLTLDDAIKSATSISDTLILDEQKITYQDKTNDITKKQDDFNNVNGDKENYDNDTADNSLNKLKQQRDFDEDILIHKVTTKYNDIVTSQMKISKAAKELEIKNKGLDDAKLKESLGITTSIDLKSTELEIENLQNTQKSSENALKDAEYSFKVLTGKDVTQYSLEQDVKFEQLKIDGSVDEYLDNAIDSYLKYSEQLINLKKDYYDNSYDSNNGISADDIDKAETAAKSATKPTDEGTDLIAYKTYEDAMNTYNSTINKYTGILASRLTYLNTKLNNYQDETNLNENKKKFKDSLKGYYTDFLTSEDKINYLKKNIEINNENLSNLKLKYDLGMITESAYNTEVVKSEQSDLDLRAEVINYNNLKEKIQKPWIAFSNS
jgi:hypothetical protein